MTKNKDVRKTCIGKSKYCYISEPDTQFDSRGIFHTSIEFTEAEAKPEIKAIDEVIAEKIAEIHKAKPGAKEVKRAPVPYKREDGKVVIKFKSQFKPKIFDRNKKPLDPSISVYKDSTMRVMYKLNAYDQTIGVGCSLYLLSVQVKDLVKGTPVGECPWSSINLDGKTSSLPGPEKAVAL